jgi:hypothetical protein
MEFEVNYHEPVSDLYIRFARSEITHTSCLDILNAAGAFRQHNVGIPSWVPDWSGKKLHNPLLEMSNFAAGITKEQLNYSGKNSTEEYPLFLGKSLCFEGITLGKVVLRSRTTSDDPSLEHLITHISHMYDVYRSRCPHVTSHRSEYVGNIR